jgi:NAD-dependent dihydropyrimidine dehydrogenase PreA subunit
LNVKEYKHSVALDLEKCRGCTNCLKRGPTEAIRIREGHAVINSAVCIDCGECIRMCPYKAKKAVFDNFEDIFSRKYKIALPAPSLYGQFEKLDDIDNILQGLVEIGFDEVFEVARAAELVPSTQEDT